MRTIISILLFLALSFCVYGYELNSGRPAPYSEMTPKERGKQYRPVGYDLDIHLVKYATVRIKIMGMWYELKRVEPERTLVIRCVDREIVGFFDGEPDPHLYQRWKSK
jgi:hypothetical protein